jgi:hypothetical protein
VSAWARSRCRCGRGDASPPAQMWQGRPPILAQMTSHRCKHAHTQPHTSTRTRIHSRTHKHKPVNRAFNNKYQTRACVHDRAHGSYAPGNQAIGRQRSISRIKHDLVATGALSLRVSGWRKEVTLTGALSRASRTAAKQTVTGRRRSQMTHCSPEVDAQPLTVNVRPLALH